MAINEFEKERLANMARNQQLLKELGVATTVGKLVPRKPKPAPTKKQKRKRDDENEEENHAHPSSTEPLKAPRTTHDAPGTSVRRSTRNAGKTVDYNTEQTRTAYVPPSVKSGIRKFANEGPLGRDSGKRVHDPKTFGAIPGVDVGTWWETREGCSLDAIHAPWVAGISGGKDGAYSVALSGGYDDDVDLGYAFTYTGSGGRDLKGTKANPKNLRTAPQSCDQSFENSFNAALKRSSETKKPVRVIRGYKLQSPYSPAEGYRYDGLYRVEKAWMERGLNKGGFLVCKFAFKRLDGQPALPLSTDKDVSGDDDDDVNGDGDVDDDDKDEQDSDDA